LATGEDFRSLAWRFGVGKSTACEIVNDVCEAIVDVLLSTVLKWPTSGALALMVFSRSGVFPNVQEQSMARISPLLHHRNHQQITVIERVFTLSFCRLWLITNTGTTTPEYQSVQSVICGIKTFVLILLV
jgi:hypothetical protein